MCASISCRWRCCICSASRCRGVSAIGPATLGGGEGFRWEGYDDAWTEVVDASGTVRHVQSVPGGTHWGGGVSISARDQALVAVNLMLIGGR